MAAAKSLINYFRDVCPQLLPKKYAGRFTVIETKEAPVYGQRAMATTVDGIELHDCFSIPQFPNRLKKH